MVLSKCRVRHSNEIFISLYIPRLTGHLPSEAVHMIDDVKAAVEMMGGKKNASSRFLNRGCTDVTINGSANTTVCRSVMQIPRRNDIPKNILCLLDSGIIRYNYKEYNNKKIILLNYSMLST